MTRPRVTEILSPFMDFSKVPPDVLAKAAATSPHGIKLHCERVRDGLFEYRMGVGN